MAPTSKREISSRSSTSCWNRSTSADSRSSAVWARSGISSRLFSSTSTEAARVMRGERSSWLTSEAKRASRSTRSSSACAMWLNGTASTSRSGSSPTVRRVSRRPPAMASAAMPTSSRGARARRAAHQPSRPPAIDGEQRRPEEGDGQVLQGALRLGQRHDLEVGGIGGGDGHADGQVRLTVVLEAHAGRGAGRDLVAQGLREGVLAEVDRVLGVPLPAVEDDGLGPVRRGQRTDERLHGHGRPQAGPHRGRVHIGPRHGGVLPLLEQVLPGQPERRHRQERRQQCRTQGVGERQPGSQSEPSVWRCAP